MVGEPGLHDTETIWPEPVDAEQVALGHLDELLHGADLRPLQDLPGAGVQGLAGEVVSTNDDVAEWHGQHRRCPPGLDVGRRRTRRRGREPELLGTDLDPAGEPQVGVDLDEFFLDLGGDELAIAPLDFGGTEGLDLQEEVELGIEPCREADVDDQALAGLDLVGGGGQGRCADRAQDGVESPAGALLLEELLATLCVDGGHDGVPLLLTGNYRLGDILY